MPTFLDGCQCVAQSLSGLPRVLRCPVSTLVQHAEPSPESQDIRACVGFHGQLPISSNGGSRVTDKGSCPPPPWQGFMGEVRSSMLAELSAETAGAVVSCMTRGLAIESLLEMQNPRALQALLAMAPADALRLLQHVSDADAFALAKVGAARSTLH